MRIRFSHLNLDPSKRLIYTLSKLGFAEGSVRCGSKKRTGTGSQNVASGVLSTLLGNASQPRV